MTFYTSLSGLNAAQTDLNVTSNNIANSNSTGFKSSRAEFGDLISSSAFQAQNTNIGQGTKLKSITQDFTQGAQQTTSRALDLMISGQGYFATKSQGTGSALSYTRDGAFSVDSNDNVVDSENNVLQVLPVDSFGNVTATGSSAMVGLNVPETHGAPVATSSITDTVQLPSSATKPTTASFSPSDTSSYNYASSTTVYDAAGNGIPATSYYVYNGQSTDATTGAVTGSSWTVHTYVGDTELKDAGGNAATLSFGTDGKLSGGSPVAYAAATPTGASAAMQITTDYSGSQTGSYAFASTATQNGNTVGKLDNLAVGNDGLVSATYSDGSTVKLGKVAIATFTNPNGLHQDGNTTWTPTAASGVARIGAADSDGNGSITSGALEMSNTDLTAQLVNLISAQRNFQANAKAIDTDKQMLSYILNLQ